MKMLSCFSGIGAFEKALVNLGIKYDLVGFSEIDKYAVKSYCAIHGVDESLNLGDITKIDANALPKDIDLFTYGFPCQDISISGLQKGMFNEDGSLTRSGLFFEALRIIEEARPRVAIAENVKNLVGKKFKEQFQVVLASLEEAGYNNYWAVLNLKDFGIPQNRERVFIVSVRKDVDNGEFKFPKGFPLEIRLKDILESEVDEKYYLDGKFESITYVNDNYCMLCGGTIGKMHDISRQVYNPEYISPSIHTCGGGNLEPKVAVAMRGRYNEDGRIEQHIEVSDRECANAITTVQKDSLVGEPRVVGGIGEKKSNGGTQWYQQDRIYADECAISVTTSFHPYYATGEPMAYDEQNRYIRKDGCVGTIMTDGSSPKKNSRIIEPVAVWDGFNQRVRADSTVVGTLTQNCGADLKRNGQGIIESTLRIRKLTPKECFRLMGFDDADFEKAEAVNSNTQLYKQAGNSIGVPCLEHIYKALLKCGAIGDT